ncbi:MAG: class I SAM-dependent methyltransferase [Rhodocyclaceae bacterium]|nr:class I SAM-dependent methyltransferase [Rhodocyclaceae bacterium]
MAADHFSRQASAYAKYRPSYPEALFSWLASLVPSHELAWDVGCGNGQASVPLAAHFKQVLATDLSVAQISAARPHPRIHYRAAPCHESGLPDASCDLVTVAQAIHWFDFDAFYAEVRRVLKPGGLIAAWTYQLLRGEPAIDATIARFYAETLSPWWPPERRWVEAGYAGMPFPFAVLPAPSFEIRVHWTLADLVNYIGTWSAVQRCLKETGRDPTLELLERLRPVWGEPARRREIVWPIALVAGRLMQAG